MSVEKACLSPIESPSSKEKEFRVQSHSTLARQGRGLVRTGKKKNGQPVCREREREICFVFVCSPSLAVLHLRYIQNSLGQESARIEKKKKHTCATLPEKLPGSACLAVPNFHREAPAIDREAVPDFFLLKTREAPRPADSRRSHGAPLPVLPRPEGMRGCASEEHTAHAPPARPYQPDLPPPCRSAVVLVPP